MAERSYEGGELELFARAIHWKSYWARTVAPHVAGRVLDVGAGIGATVQALAGANWSEWTALEPDPGLCAAIQAAVASGRLPANVLACRGTLEDLPPQPAYDTILYVDVLEHILEDGKELANAAQQLAEGGNLIVLAPAHQWLFTPFDRAIGHHRRYSRSGLAGLMPPGLRLAEARYLDSAGLLASLGNKLLLRSGMPTVAQIALWDRMLVPLSTRLDRLLLGRVGKSVLVVFSKPRRPEHTVYRSGEMGTQGIHSSGDAA